MEPRAEGVEWRGACVALADGWGTAASVGQDRAAPDSQTVTRRGTSSPSRH